MKTVSGRHNTARLYGNGEESSDDQFVALCNQAWLVGEDIWGMPDRHWGAGTVSIGTVMTLRNRKVSPFFVGVDIDCGMLVAKLKNISIDRAKLDQVIRRNVPVGFNVNRRPIPFPILNNLTCYSRVNIDRALHSIGSLGGGNHFLEGDRDENGDLYFVIHTGSRGIGSQVAKYHQDIAKKRRPESKVKELIESLKSQGRQKDISFELGKLSKQHPADELPYISGVEFDNYVNDMLVMSAFAAANRREILRKVERGMDFDIVDVFETVHNTIDFSGDVPMLRKGAVSAQKGERLLIPFDRVNGAVICEGKGNPDYGLSAPHGSGRTMSRKEARVTLSLEDEKQQMEERDIYSTTVDKNTIDENSQAYKNCQEILDAIEPTVTVLHRLLPVFNFKDNTKEEKRRR